ncbi:MAG: hypothetical protein PHV68_05010, partial [Candidatus Gastranaerophilales bacterium]|nr:hypothetical protein [Candidatus Gastranaerophilales bacterium]
LFLSLTKDYHIKIKNLLNRVNNDICSSFDWGFLNKMTSVTVESGLIEHNMPINGKIKAVFIDNVEYFFNHDFESFYNSSFRPYSYSIFDNKLLLPSFDEAKSANIFYFTNQYALDENNSSISAMSNETDSSIIPAPFDCNLLVYGSCVQFKAMPESPKYKHWYAEYIKALKNLKSQFNQSSDNFPKISF